MFVKRSWTFLSYSRNSFPSKESVPSLRSSPYCGRGSNVPGVDGHVHHGRSGTTSLFAAPNSSKVLPQLSNWSPSLCHQGANLKFPLRGRLRPGNHHLPHHTSNVDSSSSQGLQPHTKPRYQYRDGCVCEETVCVWRHFLLSATLSHAHTHCHECRVAEQIQVRSLGQVRRKCRAWNDGACGSDKRMDRECVPSVQVVTASNLSAHHPSDMK